MGGFSLEFLNKPYIWLDPRTKLLALFMVGFVAFQGVTNLFFEIPLFIFIFLLIINGKQIKFGLKFGIFFGLLILADIFISPLLSGLFGVVVLMLLRICRMYIPMILVFIFTVSTTTVSEFVASFEKMKISSKITIPFSVMFRFFPTIGEEWNSIRDAMAFRGIGISFAHVIRKPFKTFEYVIVPLLMSCLTIADELSAAALSRGLDHNAKRTSITKVGLHICDYFVIVISIAFIVLSLIL